MILVGTSGWSYPDWDGVVYPRTRPRGFHPLDVLAGCVDYVEINSTFYAQPREQNSREWVRRVASRPGFRFGAKLLQEFTHSDPPEEPSDWEHKADVWRRGVEPLRAAGRLAVVLVQFPVSFQLDSGAVERLAKIAGLFEGYPLVLEVRHRSWFEPPGLSQIQGLGYSLAHIDLPAAWNHPPSRHISVGRVGYVRLHGRNEQQWFHPDAGRDQRYDYLYSPPELGKIAYRTSDIASSSEETYVATNNHFGGQALANAIELRWLFGGRQAVPAPNELLASFPHLKDLALPMGPSDMFSELSS